MSNTIWAVDGSFFAQRLSGIQRYSIELLAALDRIVPPGFVEIVTPPGVETPHYTNIKVVSFGTHRGGVWQQLDARIAGYLDSVLLSSLTSGDAADEYVI